MTKFKISSIESLKSLGDGAAKNPITTIAECRALAPALGRGYRRRQYLLLSAAYGSSGAHYAEPRARDTVLKETDWSGQNLRKPQGNGPNEVLMAVLTFVFEPNYGHDRVWKYHRALEDYLNKGVKPGDVADRIKSDGGIEKLVKKAIKETPRTMKRAEKPSLARATIRLTEKRRRRLDDTKPGKKVTVVLKRKGTDERPEFVATGVWKKLPEWLSW
jgi:hypothetical protein